jgi:hypothetical protein
MRSRCFYSGRYRTRICDLYDRVGGQRVTCFQARFQPPPSEPDGHLSAYPALQRRPVLSRPNNRKFRPSLT